MIIEEAIMEIVPATRMIISDDRIRTVRLIRNDHLLNLLEDDRSKEIIQSFHTRKDIDHLWLKPLIIDEKKPENFANQLREYVTQYDFFPRIILIPTLGMLLCEDSPEAVNYMQKFVPHYLGRIIDREADVDLIEENHGLLAKLDEIRLSSTAEGRMENKVVVVTGGAQGFGKGIAEALFKEGANIIIADLNVEAGKAFEQELNDHGQKNKALFCETNVAHGASVSACAHQASEFFGGVDLLISNAGVLKAGSLDEMDEAAFDFVTSVNYKGFFVCVKAFSQLMKIQHKYNPAGYFDIIQINSKSGLQGSNKNFAYAGGKFGGIGLTQSFALELVTHNIKVNAICPGNFFEGPLWADPEKGLFAQYLAAGKVPGAKSVEDVKHFYESKVPMGRGCYPEDVAKAILYAVDQKYETGQAIPVTGGQVMLK